MISIFIKSYIFVNMLGKTVGYFRRGVHYSSLPLCHSTYGLFVDPFSGGHFHKFLWKLNIGNHSEYQKEEEEDEEKRRIPMFFQFYHMYRINYLNEKTKWRQIQMHFHFYLPVTTTAFRIYGVQSMHT